MYAYGYSTFVFHHILIRGTSDVDQFTHPGGQGIGDTFRDWLVGVESSFQRFGHF